MSSSHKHPPIIYKIQVQGELDRSWEAYFNNFAITLFHNGELPITTLIGPIADQAALRGLLCKLWDLNLTLISVCQFEADCKKEEGNDRNMWF
jgi:hypothetical protein